MESTLEWIATWKAGYKPCWSLRIQIPSTTLLGWMRNLSGDSKQDCIEHLKTVFRHSFDVLHDDMAKRKNINHLKKLILGACKGVQTLLVTYSSDTTFTDDVASAIRFITKQLREIDHYLCGYESSTVDLKPFFRHFQSLIDRKINFREWELYMDGHKILDETEFTFLLNSTLYQRILYHNIGVSKGFLFAQVNNFSVAFIFNLTSTTYKYYLSVIKREPVLSDIDVEHWITVKAYNNRE